MEEGLSKFWQSNKASDTSKDPEHSNVPLKLPVQESLGGELKEMEEGSSKFSNDSKPSNVSLKLPVMVDQEASICQLEIDVVVETKPWSIHRQSEDP